MNEQLNFGPVTKYACETRRTSIGENENKLLTFEKCVLRAMPILICEGRIWEDKKKKKKRIQNDYVRRTQL